MQVITKPLIDLYPLTFTPSYHEKIWGGDKIKTVLGRNFAPLNNCGESWEISGESNNVSIVDSGPLKGESLISLIENYKEALVGKKIWQKFGGEFPLLIKFIDAKQDLSIQVHPNDSLAERNHGSRGKTEMWYVIQADDGAELINGFTKSVNKEKYLHHLKNKSLKSILNVESVVSGDVFFLPAGRVHAIGAGILLVEIQQTSDITYRIYDWDRVDSKGGKRQLHTQEALAAMDFNHIDPSGSYKATYKINPNIPVPIVTCPYFKTSIIASDKATHINHLNEDSFFIYIVTQGKGEFVLQQNVSFNFQLGDVFLFPASLTSFKLIPEGKVKIIETYIP